MKIKKKKKLKKRKLIQKKKKKEIALYEQRIPYFLKLHGLLYG